MMVHIALTVVYAEKHYAESMQTNPAITVGTVKKEE